MAKRTKVTKEYLQSRIVDEAYTVLPDERTTICVLTMANDFTVWGESSCVCKEEFNKALGEEYAFKAAFDKAWAFEGYLLAEERNPSIEGIARLCHEANRAYCQSMGDNSQLPWEEAPIWAKSSAINGVMAHMASELTPEQSHECWMAQKLEEGWVYSEEKDTDALTHPCLVPYDQLPRSQKAKDYIFRGIVRAFKG